MEKITPKKDLKDIDEQIKELKNKRKQLAMNGREVFQWKKLRKMFYLGNGVEWIKSIKEIIDLRKVIIYSIVGLIIAGFFYFKGISNKPIVLGYRDFIAYVNSGNGIEHKIEIRKHQMYFDNKLVKVSDVPQLKPYGIELKPKLFAGVGMNGGEVGLGAEVAHYFKWNFDMFGTQRAFYGGISYDIDIDKLNIHNSSTGIAVGKGWDLEDVRFLWYWSMKF